ncbi:PP2C family protein-serine/threonine phosphatase [Streptomyces gibsoniae]|uniref:SpoIIE family protein phosphatase n=1 Tax=Streptomyces gibsoniae TaxID=3075529 RepID=A0ABU2U5R0_9ACTN|nr:SpoIIE family protein phosphatase [Streptomyces sp. DSM 41699]MDT0468557.1 SpoIIE family protein phosphatase [Streptomyces sp. DSM 41699]
MKDAASASRPAPGSTGSIRLRLLADIGVILASSLDLDAEEALRRLSRRMVAQFADACVVDLLDGDRVRRIAVTHRDPDRAVRAWGEGAILGLADSADPLARVLRGAGPVAFEAPGRTPDPGTPVGVGPASPGSPPGARDAGSPEAVQEHLYRVLEAGCVLIVPLLARSETLGALTLTRPRRVPFGEEDQQLAIDVGRRAGLALENARLYAFQRNTAEQLQRSLLPDLSEIRGIWLSDRYSPARAGAEVGGDWYDAFTLPDRSTMLVIGDVIGHDLTAAVRMGQLRNMLRALAYDSGDTPAGVMCRLDRVMQGMTSIELVTAVIARLHSPSAAGRPLSWTNAGHPPPLLTLADGTTRLLEDGHAPILGLDPPPRRTDAHIVVPPGATVLLYTDGLIERPGEDIGCGLTRLQQRASALATQPLDAFCDSLLLGLGTGYHDDVAVLAFRNSRMMTAL